ncbi:MAG: hypothetical protein JRJ47_04205 [Deltaproteobacteria bacterium]|nr:hypothetical protein [Deltaproteobacteria bacterium]
MPKIPDWHINVPLLATGGALAGWSFWLQVSHVTPNEAASFSTSVTVYGISYLLLTCLYGFVEGRLVSEKYRMGDRHLKGISLVFCLLSGVMLFRALLGTATLIDLPTLMLFVVLRLACLIKLERFRLYEWMRERSNQLAIGVVLMWWIAILAYVFVMHGFDCSKFIWPGTDARHYKWLSNSLVTLTFAKSYFPLGLPLLMSPPNLICGTFGSREIESLVALNPSMIVLLCVCMMGVAHVMIATSTIEGSKSRVTWARFFFAGFLAVSLTFVYALVHPPYTNPGDVWKQPLMMLGLVPAVEPVNFLFTSLCALALMKAEKASFWTIGGLAGFAVMTKESNAVIFGLFSLFYFFTPGCKWNAIKAGLFSVGVYALQLIYNISVFDGWLGPNRAYQWARQSHKWVGYVKAHYGVVVENPPRMSWIYAKQNLPMMLDTYFWPLSFIVVCYVFLVVKRRYHWQVWTFCLTTIVSFIVFHSYYIRIGATFRYFHSMLPLVSILAIPSVYLLLDLCQRGSNRRIFQ